MPSSAVRVVIEFPWATALVRVYVCVRVCLSVCALEGKKRKRKGEKEKRVFSLSLSPSPFSKAFLLPLFSYYEPLADDDDDDEDERLISSLYPTLSPPFSFWI